MAALTLTWNHNYAQLTVQSLLRQASSLGFQVGHDGPDNSVWPCIWLCCCLSLLDEDICLKQAESLQTAVAGLNRHQLLELAVQVRQRLGLSTLPVLLLAEASVRHSGNACEAKGEVRRAVAALVRDGAEATRLLAYWLRWLGLGSKQKLPNALKKGLSEALSQMSAKHLLSAHLAMPLRDLLCLVHAKPRDEAQAALYRQLLTAEQAPASCHRAAAAQRAELQNLAAREQDDLAELLQEAARAELASLNWLIHEREAETAELKAVLAQGLGRSLQALPRWQGRTAVLLATGEGMLERLPEASALQRLDIGAMLGALAAAVNPCRLAAFASSVSWIEAAEAPAATALRLRQAETGWGCEAWQALAGLREQGLACGRVLIFAAGAPDARLLASWQRYRETVADTAVLYWIDVGAAKAVDLDADCRLACIGGWSARLLELMALIEARL